MNSANQKTREAAKLGLPGFRHLVDWWVRFPPAWNGAMLLIVVPWVIKLGLWQHSWPSGVCVGLGRRSQSPRVKCVGAPEIYTTTGLGPRKNREMAGVDDLVVYIQTAVFYSSLHIHHQIVHTNHFPIFPRPKPGGGVYLWGPQINTLWIS